jgi:type IV pilus assembly protein PilA
MRVRSRGFTLLELMVVIAIIFILATLALPSMQDKLVRDQIVEAVKLAELAKTPVGEAWRASRTLPRDNESAGLPAADKLVSNWIRSVVVEDGAIHLTFGNQANGAIRGKRLTLRPAVVDDTPIVPVAWVCGHARAPDKMTAKGVDRTDVAERFLPLNCR